MPTTAPHTLMIAYEIASPNTVRTSLVDAIMTLGEAWARPLDTVWLLRTGRPAAEVEGCLAQLIGDDDGLMVQETRGEAFLVNSGVRWFRRRRTHAVAGDAACEVVHLHSQSDGELDRAA